MFSIETRERQDVILNTIFDEDLGGFIKIRSGNRQRFFNSKNLRESKKLENQLNAKYFSKEKYYLSLCTYKSTETGAMTNISAIQGFQVDIDFKKMEEYKELSHQQIIGLLELDHFNQDIPIPNYIEVGNNLRLIYLFNSPVGATKKSINLINKTISVLTRKVAYMGGDKQTVSSMIRLPGSINEKEGSEINFIPYESSRYELSDIRDGWLEDYVKRDRTSKKRKVTFTKTEKTLHLAREKDLMTLLELRNQKMSGHRSHFIFIYSAISLAQGYSKSEILKKVEFINQMFSSPLSSADLKSKISTRFRKFKTQTIIDYLDITPDEMKSMSTLFDYEEKRVRRKERHQRDYVKRTNREDKGREMQEEVKFYKDRGFKQKEIAEKLGIALSTVKKYSKKISLEEKEKDTHHTSC